MMAKSRAWGMAATNLLRYRIKRIEAAKNDRRTDTDGSPEASRIIT